MGSRSERPTGWWLGKGYLVGELQLLCTRVWLSGQLLERLFEAFSGLELYG